MKLVKAKLKDVLPNPYRDLARYPIDAEKCKQLVASINETGFWLGIRGRQRPGDGKIEIAFGHNRMAAAKEALGPSYEATFEVQDFSELEMLRMMAHENSDIYAKSLEHSMLCVEQTKTTLDAIAQRVPTLGLESKATSESGKRSVAWKAKQKFPSSPTEAGLETPHPGDLAILRTLFATEQAFITARKSGVGRDAITKFLKGALSIKDIEGCLLAIKGEKDLGVSGYAQTLAESSPNLTAMRKMDEAIRTTAKKSIRSAEDLHAITKEVRARISESEKSGGRSAGSSRAIARTTQQVIRERAEARGDIVTARKAELAEIKATLDRLPADIRAASNALARFVTLCQDKKITSLRDTRDSLPDFGGIADACSVMFANIEFFVTTFGLDHCNKEIRDRFINSANAVINTQAPRLHLVKGE